ncbi:MAG: response regulator [Bacteroidales bacterium]|nr:response regulator [Bacteroidales bacterium]
MKILIIEDDFISRNYLRDLLRYSGYEAVSARNVPEGLDSYIRQKPDMIICDILLPGVSGLEFLKQIREKDLTTFILMVATQTSERVITECFRNGANDFLKHPILDKDILPKIAKQKDKLENQHTKTDFGSVISGNINMVFPIGFDVVYKIAERVFDEFIPGYFSDYVETEIRVGLSELICNAVEHGNLGITFSEKKRSTDEGNFEQLIRERLEDPVLSSRRVKIEFSYNEEECQWVITDDGDGFDYNNISVPSLEENKEGFSGRGINLSKALFDSIEYIGKGNVVKVKKKRSFLI